jgi:hypothetical protein
MMSFAWPGPRRGNKHARTKTKKHSTTYHRKGKMHIEIHDLMEVRTTTIRTTSFCFVGNPPAQQGILESHCVGVPGGEYMATPDHPWWYDPDASRVNEALKKNLEKSILPW